MNLHFHQDLPCSSCQFNFNIMYGKKNDDPDWDLTNNKTINYIIIQLNLFIYNMKRHPEH